MLFANVRNIVNGRKQENQINANKKISAGKRFGAIGDERIWSKAGIVQFRLGSNVYECRSYPFDRAIQKTVNADPQGKSAGWAKHVKGIYERTNIPCHHALTGRVSAQKICTKNYECYHCAYDQMLDDEETAFIGA